MLKVNLVIITMINQWIINLLLITQWKVDLKLALL